MASQDLHNQVLGAVAFDGQTIGSSTTTDGNIIDTQGYESLEFFAVSSNYTDGSYEFLVKHDDDSGFGTATAVEDDFLLGTEAEATLDGDNQVKRLGYVGHKRYVRLSIVSTAVTTGSDVTGLAVLSNYRHQATANN